MIRSVSHAKLKVLERSTGNKKVEKWTFLPKNWQYHMKTSGNRPIIFEENFVILEFHTWGNLSTDIGDILILNLVTRTKFWMRSTTLITQIKEKAAGHVDFGELDVTRAQANRMFVESDRLVISFSIRMEGELRAVKLG